MKSCRADWRAAKDETTDATTYAELPFVDPPVLDYLVLSLEKSTGWSEDVGSVGPRLVQT